MFVLVLLYLWIIHSQICFRALPPGERVVLRVSVYSNLGRTFCVWTSVKTGRGRDVEQCKYGAVWTQNYYFSLRRWYVMGKLRWYSLTRPLWKSQSSAQHDECGLRKVWDWSPRGGKRKNFKNILQKHLNFKCISRKEEEKKRRQALWKGKICAKWQVRAVLRKRLKTGFLHLF